MNDIGRQPTWEEIFLAQALVSQSRAHCTRFEVGAVIAHMDHGRQQLLSTGYNGPSRGVKHCDEVGCAKKDESEYKRCRGAHAEMNAIANAARAGICIEGAWLFVTLSPCVECAKHIINAGITKVVYLKKYATEGEKAEEAELALSRLSDIVAVEKFDGDLESLFKRLLTKL